MCDLEMGDVGVRQSTKQGADHCSPPPHVPAVQCTAGTYSDGTYLDGTMEHGRTSANFSNPLYNEQPLHCNIVTL